GRSTLNHDVIGKLRWFWNQPLLNAFNLFDLVAKWWLAGPIAALAAIGIVVLHVDRGREALGFLALAIALVPLSYLPNLVIAEDWASYRSLGALSALCMVYAWLGLLGIWRALLPRVRDSRPTLTGARIGAIAVAAAVAITGVVLAAR